MIVINLDMAAEAEVKSLGMREFVWKIVEYTSRGPYRFAADEAKDVSKYTRWKGYIITTNKQKIKFLVENTQNCCEEVDYGCDTKEGPADITKVLSPQTEILSVNWGHKTISASRKEGKGEKDDEGRDVWTDSGYTYAFVDIKTPAQTVQLVASNYSNGYYPRRIIFARGDEVDVQQV